MEACVASYWIEEGAKSPASFVEENQCLFRNTGNRTVNGIQGTGIYFRGGTCPLTKAPLGHPDFHDTPPLSEVRGIAVTDIVLLILGPWTLIQSCFIRQRGGKRGWGSSLRLRDRQLRRLKKTQKDSTTHEGVSRSPNKLLDHAHIYYDLRLGTLMSVKAD